MKKGFTELEVWQLSRQLTKDIYLMVTSFPKEEMFALTNQLKRCAISIPSNIAEGCGRNTAKETIHFLYVARGSLYELETQHYIAGDLGFMPIDKLEKLLVTVTSCKKLLNGFINYYQSLTV